MGDIENQNISADGGGVMLCFGRIRVGTSNSRCQRCRFGWQLPLLADCEMTAVVSVPIWQSGDWETVKQRLGSTVWDVEKIEDAAENYIGLSASDKPQAQGSSALDSIASKGNSLWGMLTAYNCSGVRKWQQWEIDFLQHFANQKAKIAFVTPAVISCSID